MPCGAGTVVAAGARSPGIAGTVTAGGARAPGGSGTVTAGGAGLPTGGGIGDDDAAPSACAKEAPEGERGDAGTVIAGAAQSPRGGGEGIAARDGGAAFGGRVGESISRTTPSWSAAAGRASEIRSPPFSTITSRPLTERKIHPEWLSPIRNGRHLWSSRRGTRRFPRPGPSPHQLAQGQDVPAPPAVARPARVVDQQQP